MKAIVIRSIALVAGLAAALAPNCCAQAQVAGDWKGTLNAGQMGLHLVLHINAAKDGALTATLDSVDQGAFGIPVSSISFSNGKLDLVVEAVHGAYTGTVNKDATEIDGTWSQGQSLNLNFKRATAAELAPPPAPKPAPPTDIDGTWEGTLDTGTGVLHVLFKIVNTQDGLTAKMQSPDQSPIWVNTTSVKRNGSSLTVEMTGIGAAFQGKIATDKTSIDGTFTQMGHVLPLVLQRIKE